MLQAAPLSTVSESSATTRSIAPGVSSPEQPSSSSLIEDLSNVSEQPSADANECSFRPHPARHV